LVAVCAALLVARGLSAKTKKNPGENFFPAQTLALGRGDTPSRE
jgi:hypothetical protein